MIYNGLEILKCWIIKRFWMSQWKSFLFTAYEFSFSEGFQVLCCLRPGLNLFFCEKFLTKLSVTGLMYPGKWSETHQIKLQRDCHLVQPIILQHSRKMALNLNAGVIAGNKNILNQSKIENILIFWLQFCKQLQTICTDLASKNPSLWSCWIWLIAWRNCSITVYLSRINWTLIFPADKRNHYNNVLKDCALNTLTK